VWRGVGVEGRSLGRCGVEGGVRGWYLIEGNFQGSKFSWFLVRVGVNNVNSLTLMYYLL
jgi:hypothetical protein